MPLDEKSSAGAQTNYQPNGYIGHLLKPLGNRDFRLFWIGQICSSLGSSFQVIALAWFVLQTTGSVLSLTIALLALAIPQALMTPIGGVIVDRLDPRTLLLWSDGARVITAGLLAVMAMTGSVQFVLLCCILACHGIATGLFSPASGSIVPRLTDLENLDRANSLAAVVGQLGLLLGVLPAGFLVAHASPALAFALNACSYLVAFGFSFCMKPLEREQRKRSSVWRDVQEGWSYLKTLNWLSAMLCMDALMALAAAGSNSVGLPELAKHLHTGATGYSVFLWSVGCGAVLGMLLPLLWSYRRHRGLLCILFQCVEAMFVVSIAFAPPPLVALCLIGWNILNGTLIVLTLSLIQANVVRNKLGRVMSFWQLASSGLIPLSQLGAGLVTSLVGVQALFVGAGSVIMLGAILGGSVAALRQLN